MSNNLPKITIITPSFNQGEFLEQTIDSVLSQGYSNLEYIVIDGGSTDNSVGIIKKYEKHLSYWISEKDRGQSEAINKGLAKATGDVCNWLCSDDFLEPGALRLIGEAFQDPDVDVISGDEWFIYDNPAKNRIVTGTAIKSTLYETAAEVFMNQPVTYMRMKFYREFGFLNENLHYLMDYELWLKYLIKYGQSHFKYIDNVLAHYRYHEKSKSSLEMDDTRILGTSRFTIDKNAIFEQLALCSGNEKSFAAIHSLTDSLGHKYRLEITIEKEIELVNKIVATYLIHFSQRCYYANDIKRAKIALSGISPAFLDKKQKSDYKYLRRKTLFK